jgi:hypothetical protein
MKQNSKRRHSYVPPVTNGNPLENKGDTAEPRGFSSKAKELILKQDVTQEFKSPLFHHANIIVSE